MSYRTLKRALGETNLERKCRVLFGFCLAFFIFGAFYIVDGICQQLIKKTQERAGRDAVDMALVYIHWKVWQTDPRTTARESDPQQVLDHFSADLLMNRYQSEVLSYGPDEVHISYLEPKFSSDPFELSVLKDLRAKWEEKIVGQGSPDQLASNTARETPSGALKPVEEGPAPTESEMPFQPVPLPDYDKFYYYQPVRFTTNCNLCHAPVDAGALSASERESFKSALPPFRVVRVMMPYKETRKAEIWVFAILWAAGILTVFLAMIGLYLIVRYVILKPLKHLRDVSEEISRGNTTQRADIHTNDEFEELADAFNRMLRHLTEAQEQLRATNTKLDTKVDELAQVNMQLYEMNRLKSDFLANMSHELRTPLNSIIGFSEVLQGIESLTDKQRRYADNIQKSGRMLRDMINDVLDLAKLEAGRMEIRPTEFRFDVVVNAQCDMTRPLTEDKNIDLSVSTDSEGTLIYQDQYKVQQILTNLLSNAIKFTPEGGRITVRAGRNSEDQFELTVADTGVGIPDEDRAIIFEKFRQSKTVLGRDGLTREYSGTGLGLSIVKELCKLLGGEISFVSELGKGSTFKVVLPSSIANRPRTAADAPPSTIEDLPPSLERTPLQPHETAVS